MSSAHGAEKAERNPLVDQLIATKQRKFIAEALAGLGLNKNIAPRYLHLRFTHSELGMVVMQGVFPDDPSILPALDITFLECSLAISLGYMHPDFPSKPTNIPFLYFYENEDELEGLDAESEIEKALAEIFPGGVTTPPAKTPVS